MYAIPPEVNHAFFARFGGRLTPIQRITFEQFQPARDGLVVAPTGTGKTEAAFIPATVELRSRKRHGDFGLLALVVSPTRALATDLHRRMAPPLEKLGLRLDVATSDRDTRSSKSDCNILIRTPEGLDATLCRHPDSLAGVSEVLVDEIHHFLDSPRGTQLVGLLERLSALAPSHRRTGISATLPDPTVPERLRLLRNPIIAKVSSDAESSLTIHHWIGQGQQGVSHFLRCLRNLGSRKCIAFARSKARVEEAAALLDAGWLSGNTLVHHGSLSSSRRRQVEERLRRMPLGLVIATTTLELGIDIGDLDTCILLDPPPNHLSFLQRVGRVGRRGGVRRVVVVGGLYENAVAFAPILAFLKSRSALPPQDVRPFLSGCLQQATSFVAACSPLSANEVHKFLMSAYALSKPAAESVVSILIEQQMLDVRHNNLRLSAKATLMLENHSLHRTFSTYPGSVITDLTTGKSIGKAIIAPHVPIRLGGKGLAYVGLDPHSARVLTSVVKGGAPSFGSPTPSTFELIAHLCCSQAGPAFRA